ncbi:MAG: cold shock domain-containing protein [Candidatus Acidiferrum sp.]
MKYTGIVSTYFPNRKYGFISSDDGTSRFFHVTQYSGSGIHQPRLGEKVEFELADPVKLGKDKQAINVTPIWLVASTNDASAEVSQ